MPRPPQLIALMVGAVLSYLAICAGCPEATTRPEATLHPEGVSPLQLVTNAEAYKGKRVRVLLASRTYKAIENGVLWSDGKPERPLLLFVCSHRTDIEPLDICGTCRGLVGPFVVVDGCEVHTIPRR